MEVFIVEATSTFEKALGNKLGNMIGEEVSNSIHGGVIETEPAQASTAASTETGDGEMMLAAMKEPPTENENSSEKKNPEDREEMMSQRAELIKMAKKQESDFKLQTMKEMTQKPLNEEDSKIAFSLINDMLFDSPHDPEIAKARRALLFHWSSENDRRVNERFAEEMKNKFRLANSLKK